MIEDALTSLPYVIDAVRWVLIFWLMVCLGWVVQLAVIVRMRAVTYLAVGLSISVFIDIGDQFARLGRSDISYRLPLSIIEVVLITIGMYYFVQARPDVNFVRPFYFFLRFGERRRNQDQGDSQ